MIIVYIRYNSKNYPCVCHLGKTMIYSGLQEDFPAPVSGEIELCADDGFVLRTDTVSDYLRQTFSNGVLVLTNTPEPTPEPNPTPKELREKAYDTRKVITFDNDILTVTEAGMHWQYYAAEGDTAKTAELTALIAAAKSEIRAEYPDEG